MPLIFEERTWHNIIQLVYCNFLRKCVIVINYSDINFEAITWANVIKLDLFNLQ